MGWIRSLSFLLALHAASVRSACYYPNGDEAEDDKPCNPGINSTCCGPGLACLSNNLCGITQYPSNPKSTFKLGEWFVTATCTDKSWTTDACLKRCMKSANGDLYNVFVPVRQCLFGDQDRWYCSNAQTREQTLDEVCFTPSQDDEYLFQMDGKYDSRCPAYQNTAETGVGNPSTITIIGHEAIATASEPIGSVVTGTPFTVTPSSTASSAPVANPASEPKRPDYSVPIGVGIGVPLGLLVAGILVFLYLRHRRQATARYPQYQEKGDPNVRPVIHAYHAELSDSSRAGELSTNSDPHELSTEHNYVK
jgi:hypothetical protein